MPLKTSRCHLSLLTSKDQASVQRLYECETVRRYLGGTLSPSEFSSKFEDFLSEEDAIHLTVRLKGTEEFIGLLSLNPHHDNNGTEISYQFLSQYHRLGYAQETLSTLLGFVFEVLKKDAVYAETQTRNLASIKLLKRLGFAKIRELVRFSQPQSLFCLSSEDFKPDSDSP